MPQERAWSSEELNELFEPALEANVNAIAANDEFQALCRSSLSPNSGNLTVVESHIPTNFFLVLRSPPGLPASWRRKAEEALTWARASFDRSTHAAQRALTGVAPKRLNFPWACGPRDLEQRMQKMDERLREVFRLHQPYWTSDEFEGGDDLIRTLSKMANDRHSISLNIAPGSIRIIHQTAEPPPSYPFGAVLECSGKWDEQFQGYLIAGWRGSHEAPEDFAIKYRIIFDDDRLPRETPAASTLLQSFTEKAIKVREDLMLRCAQVLGLPLNWSATEGN